MPHQESEEEQRDGKEEAAGGADIDAPIADIDAPIDSLLLQDNTAAPIIKNVVDGDEEWIIKGVEGLDADARCHMNAFYANLREWHCQRNYTSILLTRAGYDKRVAFVVFLIEGGDCRSGFMAGTFTAYNWAKKYHVVTVGDSSKVLVLWPKGDKGQKKRWGTIDVAEMRLEELAQPAYAKKLFADLWKIHQDDHCKGLTLFSRAKEHCGNVTRELCKMFTDVVRTASSF